MSSTCSMFMFQLQKPTSVFQDGTGYRNESVEMVVGRDIEMNPLNRFNVAGCGLMIGGNVDGPVFVAKYEDCIE